jgi:hypothetical protein
MNGADGLQRRHTGAGHRQSGTNWDAESVLAQLGGWFDDYNRQPPRPTLGMRRPGGGPGTRRRYLPTLNQFLGEVWVNERG